MNITNKSVVYLKRILHKKMYIIMLVFLFCLSITYTMLPTKNKSAQIKVLIYSEDTSQYNDILINNMIQSSSVYSFEEATDLTSMINQIKRNDAECGYYIPNGFFDAYISGTTNIANIVQYTSPGTTMAGTINETLFSHIFKIVSGELLKYCTDMDEYNDELDAYLLKYLSSDSIFTIENTTDGQFKAKDLVYKINIPIIEICCILILFSALLGLLTHMIDCEKGYFTGQSSINNLVSKNLCIASCIIPVSISSILCAIISHFKLSNIFLLIVFSFICHLFTLLLNLLIKKSTHLLRVLPILTFISAVVVFVLGLF